jgi:hypothetical protein
MLSSFSSTYSCCKDYLQEGNRCVGMDKSNSFLENGHTIYIDKQIHLVNIHQLHDFKGLDFMNLISSL